jgi:hypothetical protein
MASQLEIDREADVRHSKEGRELIPELALLTHGELRALIGKMGRAGRDPKTKDSKNILAYMPQWQDTPEEIENDPKGESKLRILIEAWFLVRKELNFRQSEGC